MNNYFFRLIEDKIASYMKEGLFGGIYISGPKWCGKTTSAEMFAKSICYVQKLDLSNFASIDLPNFIEKDILRGDSPRLIDEWQLYPQIWDFVRTEIDSRKSKKIQFILTASTSADFSKIHHSGAGRIKILNMKTMSLYESKESNGSVSLLDLINNKKFNPSSSQIDLIQLSNIICRGGWPKAVVEKDKNCQIIKSYIENEIKNNLNKKLSLKSVDKTYKLLKLYAATVCTITSNNFYIQQMKDEFNQQIAKDTISNIMNELNNLSIIDEIEPFEYNLGNKRAITKAYKRNFTDPSIATSLLKITPNNILDIRNNSYLGFIFESLCMRDLKIYADAITANLTYYRDRTGLECDAIIELENGKCALIEIKLSDNKENIKKATKNLLNLKKLIINKNNTSNNSNFSNHLNPTTLIIITATKYGYKTKEGVYVVPITILKD